MGAIQNSINYALGTAAIASGLTNKKTAEKAQDKLDKKKDELTKTKDKLAKTTEEKNKAEQEIKDINDEEIKQNMYTGGNTFNVSKDLPTAKETNIGDAGDKIDVINTNSVNNSIVSSLADLLKSQQKINPYETEQFMGSHALRMVDSRIAAKRAVGERSKRAMIRARKMGGNE